MTHPRSPRLLTTLAVSATVALAGLAGAQTSVAATKACTPTDYPDTKLGGYFTSLQVTGVTCKTGNTLIKAYYKCRRAKGIKGSCNNRTVSGYKCTEKRDPDSQSEEQLNAKVTCKKGSKKVVHTYQQNLT